MESVKDFRLAQLEGEEEKQLAWTIGRKLKVFLFNGSTKAYLTTVTVGNRVVLLVSTGGERLKIKSLILEPVTDILYE